MRPTDARARAGKRTCCQGYPGSRRMPSQCHLLCQVRPSASLRGADALVRSRPPGRLLNDRRCLILRGKSGTRASGPRGHPDQGVRPTAYAEPSFAKTKWHWAKAPMQDALDPSQPRNEPMIPKTVANSPRNGAVAATVARPSSPRAMWRCTRTADRSAACCAAADRQSMEGWTPAWRVSFSGSDP